jgi:hypothetical protein
MEMSEYKTPDHVAYADETQHNLGRHRGLSLITLSVETLFKSIKIYNKYCNSHPFESLSGVISVLQENALLH